jgi:hypothetical protein
MKSYYFKFYMQFRLFRRSVHKYINKPIKTKNSRDLELLHWGFGGAHLPHFLPPCSWVTLWVVLDRLSGNAGVKQLEQRGCTVLSAVAHIRAPQIRIDLMHEIACMHEIGIEGKVHHVQQCI